MTVHITAHSRRVVVGSSRGRVRRSPIPEPLPVDEIGGIPGAVVAVPAGVCPVTVGAQVLLVDGNYDQAFDLSLEAAQEFGWYIRNTGYNPFTAEGKKTAAARSCLPEEGYSVHEL